MYKNVPAGIEKFALGDALFRQHKDGVEKSDFGMDNTRDLLEGGFGLYSSADLKKKIGPIKTEYYRVALFRQGTVTLQIGLERFQPVRNSLVFGFPGQIFSLDAPSDDLRNYYCLFSTEFVLKSGDLKTIVEHSPFYSYAGSPCFQVTEEEGAALEALILEMNAEVKHKRPGTGQAIRALLQLILIQANRRYGVNLFSTATAGYSHSLLFNRFIKLVSQHVLTRRKVADYATMLHVSADHLNRTVKQLSGKTANRYIDEMLLLEACALLRHSALSVAEIAYQLEFADPSHFNKFFKKLAGCTPLHYRDTSE